MNQPAEIASPPSPHAVPVPGVRPLCTNAIIAVTTLVFLGQVIGGDAFTYYGLKINDLIRQGEYWRFVTPIFFHANILHFFFNMYALYNIGPFIERPLGYSRFLMIYFFSGVTGVFASFLFSSTPSLGASGAIFGLIGALAIYLYRHTRLFGPAGRNMLYNVVFIIIINLIISVSVPNIDLRAHVGGLVTGSVLAWLLAPLWRIENDPFTGYPVVVDNNPLSRRIPLAFVILLAICLVALWLGVR
jgi:membrane associated rhomboid family serine protease